MDEPAGESPPLGSSNHRSGRSELDPRGISPGVGSLGNHRALLSATRRELCCGPRRIRSGAEIPPSGDLRVSAAVLPAGVPPLPLRTESPGDDTPYNAKDGGGGDVRSAWRRFCPLLDRRLLAGSPLREDALRSGT